MKKPLRIISGGQTGADQGGLEAAFLLAIKTGGTAPHTYRTEAGPNPELLKEKYGLKESPRWDYPPRTRKNAEDSDATVWIGDTDSAGYRCTEQAVTDYQDINMLVNPTAKELAEWVDTWEIQVLNIAGNRESKNPGIYQKTLNIVLEAFK